MKSKTPITDRDVQRGIDLLTRYKQGKANLERRIVEDELWWEMRHWEVMGRRKLPDAPKPSSAWLFNAITNKHADAMDNFPQPVVLPREPGDEASAGLLSQILPVVLDMNDFTRTYSDGWWEKLKHGTAAYGVFWNSDRSDIDIRCIDLLKLFWEPGVTDIQHSRNLFLCDLVDTDLLRSQYPKLPHKPRGNAIDLQQYLYDDTVDTSGKTLVVDWYYKTPVPGGQQVHLIKFAGDTLLYASEYDPACDGRGWYDHGQYPVVLDTLFPEKGTPVGFGYVSVCKDPQMYIDRLSANILENAMMATKKRWFVSANTAVNKQQFADWNESFIQVEGELDDRRMKEVEVQPLNGIYLSVMQMKIEEMKDTASNRDVNAGGVSGGVTAASAIAALQEAGNKTARDMIAAGYRAFRKISELCIELMRQFYDGSRAFRIVGESGAYEFKYLSESVLSGVPMGIDEPGALLYRKPVFDVRVQAQKQNPFSRMEQNERAKELYRLGFFAPERAQEALTALEMMEFEGIESVRQAVRRNAEAASAVPVEEQTAAPTPDNWQMTRRVLRREGGV